MNYKNKKGSFWRLLLINIAIIAIVLFAFSSLGKYEVVTVNAMAMNVRTGPGVDYDVATQVKKGQKLTILEEENQWYNVKIDDKTTGWVASWLVTKDNSSSPATNISAIVNTADTKLREEASTESAELDVLKENTKVTITMEQNGWSQVSVKNKEGWIYSELLTIQDDEDDSNVAPASDILYARQDDTKIRKSPSVDGEILTTLNYGENIKYIDTDGEWYQVEANDGTTGYIANWVVSFGELDKASKKKVTSIAETTIVLDPGHGGQDVGAQSNDELVYEKTVTLATARFVEKELKKLGANVLLTRNDDSYVSLSNIAQKSNKANADIFLSFHYDSTEHSNEASGTTTYYYDNDNIPLATIVNNHLEKELPLPNRGYEPADFQVLRENKQPALLLELGYMNNDHDMNTFKTKKYQRKVAKAVKNALTEYFEK